MRTQRKRIPVTLMAGSSFTRSFQRPPQLPPVQSARVIPITPQTVATFLGLDRVAKNNPVTEFHGLFGSKPPAPEKILTLDDVAPVAMPKCPHGVRLTKDEYIFECSYKRTFHMLINGKSYFVKPKSFECIKCHPVCIHGMELTIDEVGSGKRFSGKCPECVGKVTSRNNLEAYISKQKLTESWGMSMTEGELVTSYGLRITKAGKNLVRIGGSRAMEYADAVHEVGDPTAGMGKGPDNNSDNADGAHEDDLNDFDFIEKLATNTSEKSAEDKEPETDAD